MCQFHFNSNDIYVCDNGTTLNPKAVPVKIEPKDEPFSTTVDVDWPTSLPTTSTGWSSYNNSLSLDETKHQIYKTENENTEQRPTSLKNTVFIPLHSDDQTPGNRRTNENEVSCTSGSTISNPDISIFNHPMSQSQMVTESSRNSAPNNQFKIPDEMMLHYSQIADFHFYMNHNTVKKSLFLQVYDHYLKIIDEIYTAHRQLLDDGADLSNIQLFQLGINPIEIPDNIFENSESEPTELVDNSK